MLRDRYWTGTLVLLPIKTKRVMSSHKCDECGAVLDPTKVLRCTRCKACFYCSETCQKRNWRRIHKRVCTPDPGLRRFIRVEMAIERVLKKLAPRMEQAPPDATCYICLEGDGESSKLMRGCACRGESAGFVHVECLTKLAMTKEASGDLEAIVIAWGRCGNCKQFLEGGLRLEMNRRFWRHHRSNQDPALRYNSTKFLAGSLAQADEVDAANQLVDAASTCVRNNRHALLDLNILRADLLQKNDQALEALELLQAMVPEAKMTTPHIYFETLHRLADVFYCLHRHQESYDAAAEAVAFTKAIFGLDHHLTLRAMTMYAIACAKLGRSDDAKAHFNDVLPKQIRILGIDHPDTVETRRLMQFYDVSTTG